MGFVPKHWYSIIASRCAAAVRADEIVQIQDMSVLEVTRSFRQVAGDLVAACAPLSFLT